MAFGRGRRSGKLAVCQNRRPGCLSTLNFFVKIPPLVKNTRGEKVGKPSKSVGLLYVNRPVYRIPAALPERAVEKSVENVEKFGISTSIPGFSTP